MASGTRLAEAVHALRIPDAATQAVAKELPVEASIAQTPVTTNDAMPRGGAVKFAFSGSTRSESAVNLVQAKPPPGFKQFAGNRLDDLATTSAAEFRLSWCRKRHALSSFNKPRALARTLSFTAATSTLDEEIADPL